MRLMTRGLVAAACLGLNVMGTTALIADDTATYMVPAGEGLENPVELPIKMARVERRSNGRVRMDYKLPQELDGANPRRFRLSGRTTTDGRLTLRGNGVSATCTEDLSGIDCNMIYTEEAIDLNDEASDTYIFNNYTDPDMIALLQTARASLEHQAAGIVKIRKR